MENLVNVLALAEKKRKETHLWWRILWTINCWVKVLSYCFMLTVPFGLAILLYVKDQDGKTLNIAILILSALALVFDVVNRILKTEKRSILLRAINSKLEIIIAKYKDGRISDEDFIKIMDNVLNDYSKEGEL